MRSLALLPLLTACYGKIEIGDDTANTYPAPDLMVSYASGPESTTAEAGQEGFEMGCLSFTAEKQSIVKGILFKDNLGGGSETILNAYLVDENDDVLMDGMADPMGNVGVRNDENPWVIPAGSEATACLVVDFQLFSGTSQISLDAPQSIDIENSDDYAVGGDLPIDFDEVAVQ